MFIKEEKLFPTPIIFNLDFIFQCYLIDQEKV